MKKHYKKPLITGETRIALEKDFLGGSIVDSVSKVETTGQKVDSYDFGMSNGESFNFIWEE